MSPRRLWALVDGLPFDQAATWREDRPDWTRQDEWAAQIIEQLAHWGPATVYALTENKNMPTPARLIEHPDRPGGKKNQPTSDAAEIGRFFGKHISGGR